MTNVIELVLPTAPSPAEEIIREALEAKMTKVVIVGYDGDGLDYYNSSMTDAPTAIYLLQRAIHRLNQLVDKMLGGDAA